MKAVATILVSLTVSGCVALMPSAWTAEGYAKDVSGSAGSTAGHCFRLRVNADFGLYADRVVLSNGRTFDVDGRMVAASQPTGNSQLAAGTAVVVEKIIESGNIETSSYHTYVRVDGRLLEATGFFDLSSRSEYNHRLLEPCT